MDYDRRVYVNGLSKMLQAPDATKELFFEKNCDNEIEFRPKFRVYKERWFVLFLLVVVCVTSVMHIMHYTIIADIATKYYSISYTEVNWSFTVYLLAYVIFGFPATWILEKWGLRATVLLGMGATVIGSWIKVGAISPESYWIALLGQTVIAIAQALIMPIPPELAAVWFPSHQVSTACSIGVIGIEMGLAAGFIVPPLFFQCSSSGDDDVGKVLYQISMALSIVNTVVFILLIIFFKGRPKSPPSIGQLKFENSVPFLESAKTFMYNRSNILLVIAYGIVVGLMLSVSTLLNPLILSYYPDAQEDVGWIGLVMILGGMLGTIICGVALDVYGKFKQTILALSGLGIAAMICFIFAITRGIEFVYFMSAIFGYNQIRVLSK
ncbi:hypothetical protein PPYR_09364 [Photinus pyralis]|uniref:Major facilitator superfamily (MFS) profile domain-containing protein n=2 Tax=Photinus pyralis TaxID=7054 RepID=A0A5N4AM35_PHOPY|nr:hypothetical protein PPYR_09364 [Photinus pyralis]